jgi:large subunit ribosomal protein L29
MKPEELREKNVIELEKLLEDKKEALFNLRFQLAKKTLGNTNNIKATKKDIARISTLLREKNNTK